MSRIVTTVIGAAALIGLFASAKAAQAGPTNLVVNKCSASKIKSAGKESAAQSVCYSKAATKGLGVDSGCLGKTFTGLTGAFGKLELKSLPCLTNGDGVAIDSAVGAFALSINTLVGAGAASKCDAVKIRCVGKYVAGITGCYAKAAGKAPGTLVPICISKSEDKLSDGVKGCFDKAVALPDCSNASTADGVRTTAADTFIASTVCTLNPGANPDCF